ncbi:GntR family transcriptional regulator [Paenarthrobacter sp. A20]|uniref:GntR family transcriptional regulator n=1 Tax=Paenarthrobacter sp. A20 TaxID=2817891 RepID=UPI00211144A9|nr:GntR family transcriptional regulator [Paenarthrobacter sp. A20]
MQENLVLDQVDGDGGAPGVGRHVSAAERAILGLRRRLADGSLSAGDRLPSEPRLAEELGVSRVSTRTALAQLESEGLISRRRGSGTYVNSVRPLVRSLHQNIGADQLISSTGHVPGVSEMSWRQSGADAEVAERLGLQLGEPVIHLYRVRTSDGTPVTVEHDYFPASLLPEQPFNLGASLYSFLSTVCGIEISFGIADLEPAFVGEERGAVLGVDSSELCMVIKQVDYDAAETPVSYSVEYHLASAFDFRLLRQGPAPKTRSKDRA